MMPASKRSSPSKISRTHEYHRLFKAGRLAKGELLWLYILPALDGKTSIGVSVSRRIDKRSTTRNRLKRVIKAWFISQDGVNLSGYSMAVVVKKPVATGRVGSRQIRGELLTLLKRLIQNEKTRNSNS